MQNIENAVLTGSDEDDGDSFIIEDWLGTATVNGGAGDDDHLSVGGDTNFVLTSTSITRSKGGIIKFSNIEGGQLVGGPRDNTYNITNFFGEAEITIFGAGGIDTIISANDVDFDLGDALLTRSTGDSFILSSIERAELTGGFGDNVFLADSFSGFTYLNGGSGGKDTLRAGAGGSILIGGFGDDVFHGGSGRDLLFGGKGKDTLDGGANDDILFSGTTTFDVNRAAQNALYQFWNGPLLALDRVTQLRNGALLPLVPKLTATSVFNDAFIDTLVGDGVDLNDWLFGKIVPLNNDQFPGAETDFENFEN